MRASAEIERARAEAAALYTVARPEHEEVGGVSPGTPRTAEEERTRLNMMLSKLEKRLVIKHQLTCDKWLSNIADKQNRPYLLLRLALYCPVFDGRVLDVDPALWYLCGSADA